MCIRDRLESRASLQQIFSLENKAKVEIRCRCRAHRARWLESAQLVTADHLRQRLSERKVGGQFAALAEFLGLAETPERIECFDISHTMGERAVGACVVFDREGPVKSDYRRFNIDGIAPGDDYAAMAQALTRRYTRVLENQGKLPDLVVLDGGKGQLSAAEAVLEELQILDAMALLGVSKGPKRIAGEEWFHLSGQPRALRPRSTSSTSHLIQKIRDEAHRFALTGHRGRRGRARTVSALSLIHI